MVIDVVAVGQEPLETVTVYVVVTVGVATGLWQLVQLREGSEAHIYVPPPLAVRVVDEPTHTVSGEAVAPAMVELVTVTATVAVSAHVPPPTPITV